MDILLGYIWVENLKFVEGKIGDMIHYLLYTFNLSLLRNITQNVLKKGVVTLAN